MNLYPPSADLRPLKTVQLDCDLAIVGGGLAGVCCAITAARRGVKVVLVQDRPVLGGNASSEVRLWILGATSHMGNNNRWAREGGVVDEILVENMFRNPEGNALILDTILLEKVAGEENITLLLNTAVHDLEKSGPDTIRAVRAFCSQNSTSYLVSAPLFCDASGDGIVGFLAGAAFRVGAEPRSEFGEMWAPESARTDLLGHSLYFYSRDTGSPVQFVPPSFALKEISKIPRWRDFSARDSGCRLWWLEWGGQRDTIHDTEIIKWELWKVAYGVWHYIKNSGQFPEAANLTLEWVGTIPGKRESRRFEGDYMLTQQDIVEQRHHNDAVSFGGWAIDLHPSEGVYSEKPGCTQWHSKGMYQIPYRCMFSRNITNLFLAGRIISSSHIAFGSTRVMATCAHGAQAVAVAADLCRRAGLNPRDLLQEARMASLQQELARGGQFIPGCVLADAHDLTRGASIAASSELQLGELAPASGTLPLASSSAMMLPLGAGPVPSFKVILDVARATDLRAELRVCSRVGSHTPDSRLAALSMRLAPGSGQSVDLRFDVQLAQPCYAFICLLQNDAVSVHLSDQRLTGVLAVCHNGNKAVAKSSTQTPPPEIGIDSFEFWTPHRRPAGRNWAITIQPPIDAFGALNLASGVARPTMRPNAWVAAWRDVEPSVTLTWPARQTIGRIELTFDTDYDHPMESVLMGHPERVMPFCVQRFEIRDGGGNLLYACTDNHQSRRSIRFDPPLMTDRLSIIAFAPGPNVPAALFEIRCYEV